MNVLFTFLQISFKLKFCKLYFSKTFRVHLMQKSIIALVIILFYSSLFIAQNKDVINKYRPSEDGLYKTLDQGIKSKSIKFIKLLYNEKGVYSYTKEKSFEGKGKIVVFELYGTKPGININIENLSLSEFEGIRFNLFNVSNVKIDNCTFENITTGVKFEFKETVNVGNHETEIIIENCEFIDDNLFKNKVDNYFQLQFQKNAYAKGLAVLKNVTIKNCEFELDDKNKTWLIKSQHNVYPKRHSIVFLRGDINTAYSNITIKDNEFEACAHYYRTEAVTLGNVHGGNFMTNNDHYKNNSNISVIGNVMKTNSEDPGHGIFIQGPYKSVKVIRNIIKNYGLIINDGKILHCDAAIHLYGARNGKYSDDFIDAHVDSNTISAVGLGIKFSGGKKILINNNNIKILPWPKFYEKSKLISHVDRIGIRAETGAYLIKGKQSTNIIIENNEIDCSNEDATLGICVQGSKNFNVRNNKIFNTTNFGILIYGHKGEGELNVGKSVIESNTINYGNQNAKSLNTRFYNDVNFAGIKIHRMDNGKKYSKESLIVENNEIIDKSNTIPKFSVTDKTNSNLKKSVKSDIQIEE